MFPRLIKKGIDDIDVVENFDRISNYFVDNVLDRSNFHFVEISVAGSVTNATFEHRLGFVPKDIITTQNKNNVTFTVNWALTDAQNIVYTASAATTLRLLVGRYE